MHKLMWKCCSKAILKAGDISFIICPTCHMEWRIPFASYVKFSDNATP